MPLVEQCSLVKESNSRGLSFVYPFLKTSTILFSVAYKLLNSWTLSWEIVCLAVLLCIGAILASLAVAGTFGHVFGTYIVVFGDHHDQRTKNIVLPLEKPKLNLAA